MAVTTLHPDALPGKAYSFSLKSPADGGHTGDFTRLSVLGVPGGIHEFSPKTPAGEGEHAGDFTRLSVMAIPGGIHEFVAKQEAITVGEGAKEYYPRKRVETEEEEFIMLIYLAMNSGYL